MKLYKYCKFSQHLLASLAKNTMWVSSSAKFNDIFDCQYQEDSEFNLRHAKEIRAVNAVRTEENESTLIDIPEGDLTKDKLEQIRNNTLVQIKKYLCSFGIYCFSEIPDSLLLWSHYGGNHFGVCLEYTVDTLDPDNGFVRPVSYSTQYPHLALSEFHGDILKTTIRIVTTKSMEWAYEKEWRYVVYNTKDREIIHPFKLTGIIFGARIPNENQCTIEAIMKGQDVCYSKAVQSSNQYKINIQKA